MAKNKEDKALENLEAEVGAEKGEKSSESTSEAPVFTVMGQGTRDLSFECPVPAYVAESAPKDMDLNVSVGAGCLDKDAGVYDVIVQIRGEVKDEQEKSLFIVELAYGGLFRALNIPEHQLDLLLHVDAAAMLYPFARQVIMSAVTDGGYRAPMLDSINFHALYLQRQQQMAEQAKSAGAAQA